MPSSKKNLPIYGGTWGLMAALVICFSTLTTQSATLTVSTNADSGTGSFRQAILTANASPGSNTIVFQLSGTPPFTISPLSALPLITNSVLIDATSQPGYNGKPVIQLSGSLAGASVAGLWFYMGSSSLRGMAVNGFSAQNIVLASPSNTIQGNYIGTDATGVNAAGNGSVGILVNSGYNLIGGAIAGNGNLISGGNTNGIYLLNAVNNVVQGNYIGVTVSGNSPLRNIQNGIVIYGGGGNLIGGATHLAGNLISANGQSGIFLFGPTNAPNLIQGNSIGTSSSGTNAMGNGADGITINGLAGNVLSGNFILANSNYGVSITGPGATNNLLTGNYIGTDINGATNAGNQYSGVEINGASGNQIGGTNGGAANIISGNNYDGIDLINGASGNFIGGNLIGLSASGTGAVPNHQNGVSISGGTSNVIGGVIAGARNVISGNSAYGIQINGPVGIANLIWGNFLGTDISGTTNLGNYYGGIDVSGGGGNLIGGTNSGAGNVISGNILDGIDLAGGSSANVISGNLIGLSATSLAALPNGQNGLFIESSVSNIIGGVFPAARNFISGNGVDGILITGLTNNANLVLGNYIGTDTNGSISLGNHNAGVWIMGSGGNQVGGTNAGSGNVISGNLQDGVDLTAGTATNLILGNLIGLSAAGTKALPNGGNGVSISGSVLNTIGGVVASARNIISGNVANGLQISGVANNGNLVMGNYLGTDIAGTTNLGNQFNGITISGAGWVQVGGTNSGAGNLISGNANNGIGLIGGAATNLIAGNIIGLAASGAKALPNGQNAIMTAGAVANTIGGVSPAARNILSGNGVTGIFISGTGDSNNVILGNYIGTDITGATAISNGNAGVLIQGSGNTVGGAVSGSGNLISGNALEGLMIFGTSNYPSGNAVQGNIIGLNVTGTARLGNGNSGLGLENATQTLVGGSVAGARNVISGNGASGLFVVNSGTASSSGNTIQGNYIGTDMTGTVAVGNLLYGIYMLAAASNQIGGTITGQGNLISGNGSDGMWLTNSSGNVIQGNFIGTKVDGTNSLGNAYFNIELGNNANNDIVGGMAPGAGNHIAYAQNNYAGVRVRTGCTNDLIVGNSIFGNTGLGIDLGVYGVSPNVDCESGQTGAANNGQNYPVITNAVTAANALLFRGYLDSAMGQTYQMSFYANSSFSSAGYGQGQVYLGTTNFSLGSSCSSNFSITLPVKVPANWVVTATATGPANNTSEFSADVPVVGLPLIKLTLAGGIQVTNLNDKGKVVLETNYASSHLSFTNLGVPFTLQQTFSLLPPINWVANTNPLVLTNGNYVLLSPLNQSNLFFRLAAQ